MLHILHENENKGEGIQNGGLKFERMLDLISFNSTIEDQIVEKFSIMIATSMEKSR